MKNILFKIFLKLNEQTICHQDIYSRKFKNKTNLGFTKLILLILFAAHGLQNLHAQQTIALANNGATSSQGRSPQGSSLCNRSVYLITQNEMLSSGFVAGDALSAIGFNNTIAQNIPTTSTTFALYLQNSSDVSNLKSTNWNTIIVSMTKVQDTNITIPATIGIYSIPFSPSSTFTYSGGSIYIAFDYQNTGAKSTISTAFCNNSLPNGIKTYLSSTSVATTLANTSAFRPETYFVKNCPTSIDPNFTSVDPICSGTSVVVLPTTSVNGVTGTWSPALDNTATTTYTFTPTAGTCANTATMTITVNPIVTPTFTTVASSCANATLTALPTTSTNGITGTWSPALNNTATTTYTFTPTAGQCANTTTQMVTISNPSITSAISFVDPNSVTIDTQVWTNKNLDVTTYRDGTPIPQVTDPTAWAALTTGAWCYYNNDPANGAIYGKLYNWYAVAGIHDTDPNTPNKILAPPGWHVPSEGEWNILTNFLGGNLIAGGKMKSIGTTQWLSPNTAATNSSGFTGLPGGRMSTGNLSPVGNYGWWWSSSVDVFVVGGAVHRGVRYDASDIVRGWSGQKNGLSVRLVKD